MLDCDQLRQTGRRRILHLGQSGTKRAFYYDWGQGKETGGGEKRIRVERTGGLRWCKGRSPAVAEMAWTGLLLSIDGALVVLQLTPQLTYRQA